MQTADLDLIEIVANQIPVLSQSEHRIGELLLKDPAKFSNYGVREIAQIASTSEPTVVRFCKNVGCAGFKDLKIRLLQDVAVRQAAADAREGSDAQEHMQQSLQPNSMIEKTRSDAAAAIQAAAHSVSEKVVKQAASAIAEAGKVIVYGLGGSSAVMATELHNRLFRLGLHSVMFSDSYLQRMSAATISKQDVAVLISSTGRPRALLDAGELAKYYGGCAIAIAPADSELAGQVDFCLDVPLTQQGVDVFQPNPMRFAQLLAIDVLAFEVANRLGRKASDSLKRARASIASLHGIVPRQPIGD